MTLIILLLFYPSSLSYVRLKIEDEDGPNVCTDASAYNWGIITTIQVFLSTSIAPPGSLSFISVYPGLLGFFWTHLACQLSQSCWPCFMASFDTTAGALFQRTSFFFILPRKFLLQRMSALSYGIKRTVGYRIPAGWLLCLIPDDICWLIARSWA